MVMQPGRLGARLARSFVGLLTRQRPRSLATGGTVAPGADYPGDFQGSVDIRYSPDLDGQADPGEVVWGWIPFEDDSSRGKDRPALVIGRDRKWLLALMLTSKDKDHSDGAADRHEVWVDIGSGSWDRERRASDVRVDRIIRLAESAVRREGAILPRETFDIVAAAVRLNRPG